MSQTDSEQQLNIWKDLAISKQILMNEAASLLKLKEDFSTDDLRAALNKTVQRADSADADMAESRQRAAAEIEDMRAEVKKIEKARADAEAARDEALKEKEAAEHALIQGRKDNADALQKAKRQVEEKQKELKAINLALADTPENTVRKLKNLKKQKLDEANARKAAEDANRKLKKENKEQKQELDKLEELKSEAASLLASYRELQAWVDSVSDDIDNADARPTADTKLLSKVETLTEGADVENEEPVAATA